MSAAQPEWVPPQRAEDEPVLKVYNSLTRSKVEFVPTKGRTVTWYNCGPTVYDSAHMGHARNYLTQDIIRRILRDYFNYDVHFVMNITDVDDKIIVRARQSHLYTLYLSQHPTLTPAVLTDLSSALSHYTVKASSAFSLPAPSSTADADIESYARTVLERAQDKATLDGWAKAEPKAPMYVAALKATVGALDAARSGLESGKVGKEETESVLEGAKEALSLWLDKQSGATITDPAIFRTLAAHWESSFLADMSALNVERPDTLTRVSEYVPEIVSFVERIVGNGFAYAAHDGSVYFDTRAFDGAKARGGEEWVHEYARLQPGSKGNRELIEEGEGSLTSGQGKRSPADFALWKASKPGEPAWPSPWGAGRPGWHIECSVMASEVLGKGMDIHSGGVDLMFPHHDNELAQSEAFHGCRQWVNYFLHTGHLHIEGLKMSKSLKNFITIEEALETYSARQLRLAFMLQLWNAQMDLKESAMQEVRTLETSLNNFFRNVRALVWEERANGAQWDGKHHYDAAEKELTENFNTSRASVRTALCDSFNTPAALQHIADLVGATNVYIARGRAAVNVHVVENVARWVTRMFRIFGVIRDDERAELGWGSGEAGAGAVDRDEVLMPYLRALSNFRDEVRKLAKEGAPAKDILALCDRLRDNDLVELGVALDDQADGKALVKLVPAAELIAARDAKAAAAAEKAAKAAARKAEEERKRLEKLSRAKIAPADMFKPPYVPAGTYAEFDEQGVPTKDAEGVELSKKRRKGLLKEWEVQGKAHQEWVEAGRPEA